MQKVKTLGKELIKKLHPQNLQKSPVKRILQKLVNLHQNK